MKTVENTVDNIVFNGVKSVFKSSKKTWQGTLTQLSKQLKKMVKKDETKILPQSPSFLRVVLNRLTKQFKQSKIAMEFSRSTEKMRTRLVTFSELNRGGKKS